MSPGGVGSVTRRGRVRLLIVALVAVAVLLAVASSASAAKVRRCPDQTRQYWVNIRVRGMTCRQARSLHSRKLRDCLNPTRTVTRTTYVYTCRFGPWTSTERVGRHAFSDSVYIRRDRGRVWLRYDALP